MRFTQPTIHHVMYIEARDGKKGKKNFPFGNPHSMWFCIETEHQRRRLDKSLAELQRKGIIRFYLVSACMHGDDSWPEELLKN